MVVIFTDYGCIRQRKRQYGVVYDRYKGRHGTYNSMNSNALSPQHYTHQELY